MDVLLLAAEREWGTLTEEAGELARKWGLGAFIHPFPIQVGVVSKKVDRIYQFETGLIRQYSDKPAEVFRWDEIVTWRESVYHHYNRSAAVESNYLQSTFHYELTRDDGVTAHLEGIFRKDGSRRQGSAYNALGRSVSVRHLDDAGRGGWRGGVWSYSHRSWVLVGALDRLSPVDLEVGGRRQGV